ncbi:MAG: membrane protein insertase YidC [Candidatus Binataceae bacterium]|nr:membrane protein insertase YidC [Candidatus Binataceae bacterium]
MDSRTLIVVLLSIGLIFAYQELVLKRLYPPHKQVEQAQSIASPEGAGPQSDAAGGGSSAQIAANSMIGAANLAPRTIEIDTHLYQAVLTTRGGRLLSLRLKDFRETAAPGSPWYEMVPTAPGGKLPLGLVVNRAGTTLTDSALDYATDAPARLDATAGHPVTITFRAKTHDGLAVEKSLIFRDDSYAFDLDAAITGETTGLTQTGFGISQPLTKHAGYADIPELQAEVQGKTLTEREKALEKGAAPASGQITYAGFGDRYFLSVYLPIAPNSGTLQMSYGGDEAQARILFDRTAKISTAVYMGPKKLEILEQVNPSLSKAIDFGYLGIIALPLLRTLKLFYYVGHNYGIAIILLTLVVRALTLPMSIKGQRSMMRMQRLQPQVERIREKFKDDQERLNREMVDLYKRNHVNPLGGCLPMVIQLPILYGLYEAFLNAFELRQAPFIGWIRDLSAPDCLTIPGMPALPWTACHGIPVLVILLAITSLSQQWLSPKQPDPNQQKMMMYMPVAFSLIFINLPAGLTLYYLSSNVLGILQQVFLNYEFKQYTPATT